MALIMSGAAMVFVATPSFAQTTDAAVEGEDTIVVTARKRSETMLEVPISVSAFNAARIEDRLAQNITDIATFTPGFQINEAFGRDGDRPVIRGASNILLAEGKVGIFIDGAPFFGDFSSLDLGNVERVEVIKGPQSAVFGRGTLAGAVNVVMKRPSDHFEGKGSITIGNYDRKELSASISGPIAPWLGFQAGVKFFDIDGQYDNMSVPGERLGDQNTHQYTAALFLDPTPDISASVRWLHQEDNDSPYAIGLQRASANNCFLATRPYYCGKINTPSSFALNTNKLQRPGLHRNADRFIGDVSWDIGGSGYEASVQAGYSDLTRVVGSDQSFDNREFYLLGSPFSCLNFVPIGNQLCSQSGFNTTEGSRRKTHTYEARLASPSTDRVRWRLGIYSSIDRTTPLARYLEASELGLDLLGDKKRVRTSAVFGGVDFDVTDSFTISGELRHQVDKIRNSTLSYRAGDIFSPAYIAGLTLPNPNQIIGAPAIRNATFKATLPRITANWKIAPDLSLYAQYSQGNSPGGFNEATAPQTTYNEEKLTNYEIGLKTTKFGFDFLNVSAFWQDYKDQVLTDTYATPTSFNSYNVNIGRTRLRGVEVEGAFPIVRKMVKLQFNYTYLDAEFRRGIDPEQAVLLLGTACKTDVPPGRVTNLDKPGCRDAASIAGNRPPLVSKHTGTVGLRFDRALDDKWSMFAGADVIYTSSYYDQVLNLARSGASTKLNLQFGFHSEDGIRITLYGKNVTGDDTAAGILRYIDLVAPRAPSRDSARAFAITPPRKAEYGLIVSKSF